jgi:DNA-binding CsgD family transcriptional regulator
MAVPELDAEMLEHPDIRQSGRSSDSAAEAGLGSVSVTYSLSPRERQVVMLIIGGKTRKEVAFDLGIAHSTVRVLYRRAKRKIFTRGR